jgi:hypothetical protein
VQSQCVVKGDWIVTVSGETDFHKTHINTLLPPIKDTLVKTTMYSLNAGFEYAVLNYISFGAFARGGVFNIQANNTTQTKASASTYDLNATVNFHLVNLKHHNVFIGINIGYASQHINITQPIKGESSSDNGLNKNVHLGYRYFFKKVGISANLNYSSITYFPANSYNGFGVLAGIQYLFTKK